jgi:probable rRNA maturation factor
MKKKNIKEQSVLFNNILIGSTVGPIRLKKERINNWLNQLAQEYNREIEALEYNIMSDEELLEYNIKYLGHNTYTDIITFDLSDGKEINGTILISKDRIKENAISFKRGVINETKRVMAHGLLHLIGFKDKSPKDQKMMREAEEKAIYLYDKIYQVPREKNG